LKELLDKLLKFIEIKKSVDNQQYYIVEYNKIPLLIPKIQLISGINRAYIVSRSNLYIDKTPVDLKSVELLRAEAKLSAQKKSSTGD